LGHTDRVALKNKIKKLQKSSLRSLDEKFRVLINKGPMSVETSLKELEDIYAGGANWRVIEDGGVLSVPVEELRMIDPPLPNRAGQIDFGMGGNGNKIENYTVGQTIEHLNTLILEKYNKEKEKFKTEGKSEAESERKAGAEAYHLPQFKAVKAWQDVEAEIKLKRALEDMMKRLNIPSLIIRSVSVKAISAALQKFGLKIPHGDGEIDLILAYVSGYFLHVVIFEVKRADTYPWQTECVPLNKQAVNKAEKQLNKDVDVLMAILAGIPPSQIIVKTLASFPDASSSELQAIFCDDCLESGVVCHEDLADRSLLQKKTQVPDKPDPATTSGKSLLLTLSARCLSHQSLLHIGYREVEDKEKLVTERHRYNLASVDGKMNQKEFVVASPQQQQVIASFTASSTKRHLVLEGPAGTGKTLVALQVANKLMEPANDTFEEACNEPLLVVTAVSQKENDPILKYLDDSTGTRANGWLDIMTELGVKWESNDMQLVNLTEALAKKYAGRQIVMLVDEIINKSMLSKLEDRSLPESVRMILVLNPDAYESPLTLPPSFLHVTLTTPYRSTIAITSLACCIAKCKGLVVPKGDFGSDVEGIKPIFFDVGNDERKMKEALEHCHKYLGDNATILYSNALPDSMMKMVKEQGKKTGEAWDCYEAFEFYGSEADKVVAVTVGGGLMELITRARTHLSVILVEEPAEDKKHYSAKKCFQEAARQGLVEMVQLSAKAVEEEEEIEDETVEDVEDKTEERNSCTSGCCTS